MFLQRAEILDSDKNSKSLCRSKEDVNKDILFKAAFIEVENNIKGFVTDIITEQNEYTITFSKDCGTSFVVIRIQSNVLCESEHVNIDGLRSLISYMISNATYSQSLSKSVIINGDEYAIICYVSNQLDKDVFNSLVVTNFICSLFDRVYKDGIVGDHSIEKAEKLIRHMRKIK